MIIDRNIKIGVISSLIASIVFLYLLDPLLRLATYVLTHAFGALSASYMDWLFEEAALLSGPDASLILLSSYIALMCGVITGLNTMLLFRNIKKSDVNDRAPRRKFSPFWRRIFYVGGNILVIIGAMISIHSTMFQKRITTSFHQHLTTIAPYVSDQEIKQLSSRWTQMTCEQDYQIIYADLKRIAATNSVRLPRNRMFSFP